MKRFMFLLSIFLLLFLFPFGCFAEQTCQEIILNIPDRIYAQVGYETNIYFENITDNYTKYIWDINADIGYHLERGYRLNPGKEDIGEHYVTFTATAGDGQSKSKRARIIVSGENDEEKEISVIILGDSTTDNGKCVDKIIENCSVEKLSVRMLGTRGNKESKHEGRSGWNLEDYFTRAFETYSDYRKIIYNPFFNPDTETFDASYYFDQTKVSIPDLFIISMGINDMFPYKTDDELKNAIEVAISRIDAMIASIRRVSPEIMIGISLTIPPNHSQDAFGKAYGTWQTRERYKRNNALWVQTLLEKYADKEDNSLYLIPINCALDTVYNMGGGEEIPVNSRNIEEKYLSQTGHGAVHPSDEGYWQLADVYAAFLQYISELKCTKQY